MGKQDMETETAIEAVMKMWLLGLGWIWDFHVNPFYPIFKMNQSILLSTSLLSPDWCRFLDHLTSGTEACGEQVAELSLELRALKSGKTAAWEDFLPVIKKR